MVGFATEAESSSRIGLEILGQKHIVDSHAIGQDLLKISRD
jgi:hypothetical protein